MVLQTFEPLPSRVEIVLKPLQKLIAQNNSKAIRDANTIAERFGFKDGKDMTKNTVRYIPEDIRLISKYLNVFEGEDAWVDLEPILFKFWS